MFTLTLPLNGSSKMVLLHGPFDPNLYEKVYVCVTLQHLPPQNIRWPICMTPLTQISFKVYMSVCNITLPPPKTMSLLIENIQALFSTFLASTYWTLPLTNFKEKVLLYTKVCYFKMFFLKII